jgi:hypothetical protein
VITALSFLFAHKIAGGKVTTLGRKYKREIPVAKNIFKSEEFCPSCRRFFVHLKKYTWE